MRGYEDLIEYIASAARAVIDEKGRAVFAIDGRCASGKTTASPAPYSMRTISFCDLNRELPKDMQPPAVISTASDF